MYDSVKNILMVTLILAPLVYGQSYRNYCITPELPLRGRWTYTDHFGRDNLGRANQQAEVGAVITFRCEGGYKLSSSKNVQQNIQCLPTGEWSVTFPTCDTPSVQRSSNINSCIAPELPLHGRWTYTDRLGSDILGTANKSMDVGAVITFRCEGGLKLSSTKDNQQNIVCLQNGEWSLAIFPTCDKLCSAFNNTDVITYKCRRDSALVPCTLATDDTVMTYKCASGYEPVLGIPSTSVCLDGTWDYLPRCVPACGEKRVSSPPLIVNGREVQREYYPWVVAIYSNLDSPSFNNICGGTLTRTNIVLTAAHCVTDKEDGTIYPSNYYRVGAGKYYNKYQDERDAGTAQYDEIESIVVPRDYKGKIQNYRGDIALLKTKGSFTRSELIQPICFHNLPSIESGTYGGVTGWGYTAKAGKQSDELKEVELPYIDTDDCFQQLDPDFAQRYFISDKICTGFSNRSNVVGSNGTNVCNGDGGSGLTFKNPLHNNRYFVHGIFSIAGKMYCNSRQNGLFTKVESYLEWIHIQVRHWENKKNQTLTKARFIYR